MSPPTGHSVHDWSARARSTALEALRYTQFVGVMKRALPAAAFAVIAAVLAFFFVQRQPAHMTMTYGKIGNVENDLAMTKPRLTGTDSKGNPFVVTAEAAIEDAKNPKRARLQKVEADMTLDKNGWINADAKGGNIDMTAGTLELDGGINVYSDNGYELHTSAAWIDLNKWVVDGRNPVTGQGPQGTLSADRFHFDRASNHLLLSGHVRTVLTGTKK